MRKKFYLILGISAILLVGCSSSSKTLECKDGVIYNGGKATVMVEHSGESASSVLNSNSKYKITYSIHEELEECPENALGVLTTNMTKYKKKETYFTQYMETKITYHRKVTGGYICADLTLLEEDKTPIAVVIEQMSSESKDLLLKDYTTYSIDGAITLDTTDYVRVEKDKLVDPDVFVIGKSTHTTDSTVDIKKRTLGFASGEKYDYYQFGEYLIKTLKGWDPSTCITSLKD